MAADVTSAESAPAEPAVRARPSPHRGRFLFIYGLLGAALGARARRSRDLRRPLDQPRPGVVGVEADGGGLGAAKQIAEHVGSGYRLPSGTQLVDVIAKAPSVSPATQQIPIHYIAVRGTKGAGDAIFPVSTRPTA